MAAVVTITNVRMAEVVMSTLILSCILFLCVFAAYCHGSFCSSCLNIACRSYPRYIGNPVCDSLVTKYGKKAEAQKVISKYRDPLIAAANELEHRITNLLDRKMGGIYILGNELQKEYVVESTVYVFAQFLAWREIIRNEIQFLDLGNDHETRKLNFVMNKIRYFMSTDSIGGTDFRVYSIQQRGIGDALIVDRCRCLSYAKFIQQKALLDKHVDLIRNSVVSFVKRQENYAGATVHRLDQVRKALIELMDLLDPKRHYRYDDTKEPR